MSCSLVLHDFGADSFLFWAVRPLSLPFNAKQKWTWKGFSN